MCISVSSARPAFLADNNFAIGPNNDFAQATVAMLAGHIVRQADWHPAMGLLIENNMCGFVLVLGRSLEEWRANPQVMWTANVLDMLATNWEVLPKVDAEKPTV